MTVRPAAASSSSCCSASPPVTSRWRYITARRASHLCKYIQKPRAHATNSTAIESFPGRHAG
ncbi:MAG: hypothetical protein U0835_05190 [Isosphaeraceae bacterium]